MRQQPIKNDKNLLPYNRNVYQNAAYYNIWEQGSLNPTLAARFEFRDVSIEK